ncbi:hypothetical protein JCM10908_005646 [Rhodotorula pacifica]|uniref:cytochrome P450 n=1 Tax=Rhodotorula pacifica TaxID=1495444 RepID=UPI0031787BDB
MAALADVLAWSFAHPFTTGFACTALALTAFATYWLYRIFVAPLFSPLRGVPGPPSEHPLWGNLRPLIDEDPGRAHADWSEKYGGVVRYRGLLGGDRLVLTDPAALNHVLTANTYDYAKPDEVRGDLAMVLGKGVVFAEGEAHRRQRRLMNPAFAPSNLKAMTPGFFSLAHQLRDIWAAKITSGEIDQRAWKDEQTAAAYASSSREGEAVIEVSDWLTRLTLDAIGKAGFGYDFRALSLESDALAGAFASLFSPRGDPGHPHPSTILINNIIGSCLRSLPTLKLAKLFPNERLKAIYDAFHTLEVESRKIIEAKREKVAQEDDDGEPKKDLISILLRNAEKEKLDPEELRGQLTTFLFAGHETISNSLSWVLWALVCAPEKQDRLRREVRTARRKALADGRDELNSDELNSLEYLDAVAREILRLEPALSSTPRVAQRTDLIPLSVPVPSATDPSILITHIPVQKGQMISIGVYAANRNKAIFGEDADEFRPERWLDQENKIEPKGGGGWSGLMTFLAGPRACIGYKLALLEFKAVLSVLIDTFEFDKRDPDIQIIHRAQVITRPFVAGETELGTRMPLKIRLARRDEDEEADG